MKSAVAFAGKSYAVNGDKIAVKQSGVHMENTSIEVQGEGGNLILPTELLEKIFKKMPGKKTKQSAVRHGWALYVHQSPTSTSGHNIWGSGIQRLAVHTVGNTAYLLCELASNPIGFAAVNLFNFLSMGGSIEPVTIIANAVAHKGWLYNMVTEGRNRAMVAASMGGASVEGHTYFSGNRIGRQLGPTFPMSLPALGTESAMQIVMESPPVNSAGGATHNLVQRATEAATDYGVPLDVGEWSSAVTPLEPEYFDDEPEEEEPEEEEEGDA